MKKVLLFNCSDSLIALLKNLNIEYRNIDLIYQNNTIKDLLTKDDLRVNHVLNFKESLIIFNDFTDNELDEILSSMKQENIKTDLKCIVTEHNINWKIIKLYVELLKEKRAIQNV